MSVKTVEELEMRGITIKQGFTYLAGIIAVVVSAVIMYTNIIKAIEKNTIKYDLLTTEVNTLKVEQRASDALRAVQDSKITILQMQVQDLKDERDRKNNKP